MNERCPVHSRHRHGSPHCYAPSDAAPEWTYPGCAVKLPDRRDTDNTATNNDVVLYFLHCRARRCSYEDLNDR